MIAKRLSRAIASTISGRISGAPMRAVARAAPRRLMLTSPMEASTATISTMTVDQTAMISEFRKACLICADSRTSPNQCTLNPLHTIARLFALKA